MARDIGPDFNKRYEIDIDIAVRAAGEEVFSTTSQRYKDLDYEETIFIQDAVVNALVKLGYRAIEENAPKY